MCFLFSPYNHYICHQCKKKESNQWMIALQTRRMFDILLDDLACTPQICQIGWNTFPLIVIDRYPRVSCVSELSSNLSLCLAPTLECTPGLGLDPGRHRPAQPGSSLWTESQRGNGRTLVTQLEGLPDRPMGSGMLAQVMLGWVSVCLAAVHVACGQTANGPLQASRFTGTLDQREVQRVRRRGQETLRG